MEKPSPPPSRWWSRHAYADRRPLLHARARTFAKWRNWFADRDFLEVDTAALQVSPGNEAHIAGFATQFVGPGGDSRPLYLHSSPEFACKKLLAAGEPRIFSLAHVYRNRERGPLHHPEFTMLEWYRAGEPYGALAGDLAALCAGAAEAAGSALFSHRGRTADPFAEPERITVCEAFARYARVDLARTLSRDGENDRGALAGMAQAAGLMPAPDDSWSDIFSKLLSARVEPHLGEGRIVILDEYPASEAALARRVDGRGEVSERFEAYACGVEIANAFGELTDPDEQRRRFVDEMAQMLAVYGEAYPIDEDFLAALAHMPPASGIAMGADRVVMLATGAEHVERVIWTPLDV
ncbi:MAG: lysine aminoacylase GenX [Hyphomicrobiales bacterium]|nr:lysine aminoacylase GenX [Hyphomicrobiales bacterium]